MKSLKENKFIIICIIIFILYTIFFWNMYINKEKISILDNKNTNAYLWWDDFYSVESIDTSTSILQEYIAEESYQSISLRFTNFGQEVQGKARLLVYQNNNKCVYLDKVFELNEIVDGEFKEFLFDKECVGSKKNPINLSIELKTMELESNNNYSIMISNEDTYHNMSLYINGENVAGDLIFKLSTIKHNNWKNIVYIVLCIVLLGFIFMIYRYLDKFSFQKIAMISILFFGILSNLINPHKSISDEDAHFHTAYRWSNVIMAKENTIDNQERISNFQIRQGDKRHYLTERPDITTYASILQNMKLTYNEYDQQDSVTVGRNVQHGIFPYLFTAISITICRIMRIGLYPMLFIARCSNLFFYMICMYWSIKKIPFGKNTIFLLAILPLNIQQAASFSPDGMLTAISTFVFSYILYLIFEKKIMSAKDVIIIAAIGYMLIQFKIVYVCILALIVFIPKSKFIKERYKSLFFMIVITCVIIGLMQSEMVKGVISSEASSNSVSNYYGISYLFNNPISSIKIIFNSIFCNINIYLNAILGGELQWSSIGIDLIWKVALFCNIILSVIIDDNKYKKSDLLVFSSVIIGIVVVLGIHVIFFTTGTTTDWEIIQGVAGRYFMPILPWITTMFCQNGNLDKKIHVKNINISSIIIECLTLLFVYSVIVFR